MKDGVYKLKKDSKVANGIEFKKGNEFEIVGGVLYMGGFPIPFNMQQTIISWMGINSHLLINDTRNY
tara:strand:- start:767 stop:967 length:201 start_codon:yes stop_codon:yes gene_type:complete